MNLSPGMSDTEFPKGHSVNLPTVSVIVPTYNRSRFIAEALESILRQTAPVSEIIVVDDGSVDDTANVVETVRDSRIRYLPIPHSGISIARNTGLHAASGEVIAFLDSDDRWRPHKLERQLAILMCELSVGVVFSDFVRFHEGGFLPNQFSYMPELATLQTRRSCGGDGHVVLSDAFSQLVRFAEIPSYTQTVVARRAAIAGLGFPPELNGCDDLYFCMRAYENTEVAFVDEPLVEVRRHDANLSRPGLDWTLEMLHALEMLMRDTTKPQHRRAARIRVGRQLATVGNYLFWCNDARGAAKFYFRAMGYPESRINALAHLLALPALPFLKNRAQKAQPGY